MSLDPTDHLVGRLCHDRKVIVVAGEALVDLVMDPDGVVNATLGGAPFNAARAAARLGATVQFLGALSDDRFGTLLRHKLVSDGVGVKDAPSTRRPTTLAVAEIYPSGGAQYQFYIDGTSAPLLTTSDVGSIPSDPDVFFTGGLGLVLRPMADSIVAQIERISGTTIVFVDVNCRPPVIADRSAYLTRVERIMPRVDVVKVSDEDLDYLLPGVETLAAARQLLARGPAAIVVTHGATATLVATADGSEEVAVPPPAAPIVDTIGAGDTFGAALITAWSESGANRRDLRGDGALAALTAAVNAAHVAATVVVTRRGADPPWRHELPDTWPT